MGGGGGGTTGRTGHKERETPSARHKSNTRENQQSDNEKENPPKSSNSDVQVLREGTFAEGKVSVVISQSLFHTY